MGFNSGFKGLIAASSWLIHLNVLQLYISTYYRNVTYSLKFYVLKAITLGAIQIGLALWVNLSRIIQN